MQEKQESLKETKVKEVNCIMGVITSIQQTVCGNKLYVTITSRYEVVVCVKPMFPSRKTLKYRKKVLKYLFKAIGELLKEEN